MMDVLKKKSGTAVLGLAFDGGRLEVAVLRRTNGTAHVRKAFSAVLSLDPLRDEPELVGQEIRNQLDKEGVRERRCVVCVPLDWALSLHTALPDLPEPDVQSFLDIEAERSFPYGPDALFISTSRVRTPGGEQHATQVAIPRSHIARLEKALKAARLAPVALSLSIAALQRPDGASSDGVVALVVGEKGVGLQVTASGGVAALRMVESAFEAEAGTKRVFADVIAREIRVTLGQLAAGLRGGIRRVNVFGATDAAQRLAEEIRPRAEAMGLSVAHPTDYSASDLRLKLSGTRIVSPAVCLAAEYLSGHGPAFDFLPPRVSFRQQLAERYSSKKLAWVGAAAAAIAVLVGGAFLVQQWQLSRLESRWTAMKREVQELDHLQQQIRRFRPWFDESFQSLSILRKLSEAFPEDGAVSAKTLEIRNRSTVICSGVARDNPSFLKMLDQLRATTEIGELKVDQLRGRAPLQFTFNFQWNEGGAREN